MVINYKLRNDTQNYNQTNLNNWKPKIAEAVADFNSQKSRVTDRAVMKLLDVKEKFFIINLEIDRRFYPPEKAFFTRIGALSRILKRVGMFEMLSIHGKLFRIEVESYDDVTQPEKSESKEQTDHLIYIDHANGVIMVPKELTEKFAIKFY